MPVGKSKGLGDGRTIATIVTIIVILNIAFTIQARGLNSQYENSVESALTGSLFCSATHDVGKLTLFTTNGGMWGNRWGWAPFTADAGGCNLGGSALLQTRLADEYPRGSYDHFLAIGSLWIGAITEGKDTLVSTGLDGIRLDMEFFPDSYPGGEIVRRSLSGDLVENEARSDQDYLSVYTDTSTRGVPIYVEEEYKAKPTHRTLGLRVSQTSMQWSNPMVDDFVISEFRIQNIGLQDITKMYVGFSMVPTVGHSEASPGYSDTVRGRDPSGDDICGYLFSVPTHVGGCDFEDTLEMAWTSDSDGDPNQSSEWVEQGSSKSVLGIAGLRVLEAPIGSRQSFNWWTVHSYHVLNDALWVEKDYGPRRKPPIGQQPRNFGTGGVGDPVGDANKYYVMSNGEIDFDQVLLRSITPTDPSWEYPTDWALAASIWGGHYVAYLLSVGPFDLQRGREQSIVIAYVAAPDFHTDPTNIQRLIGQEYDEWYARMNFSTLAKHAKMAEWVYDNPGFDTDGDGYSGKSRICVLDSAFIDGRWVPSIAETTFYAGDGVADWRAPGAPPAPNCWLYPYDHGIRIRFNGSKSETTKDLVSNRIDFEGYRVYVGRDEREGSLAMAASYDFDNYDKFI